ncbi:protein ITPRID1-like [Polyodon spathula]|uniref:protein ITPRID1-like n=1 Tax=Polyodon spathula TaxID=7913 RepID=UPI001B7F69FC|nr:protein ITPRID1-like [Polyodon spathula]
MASGSCLPTVDRHSSKRAPLISTKEKWTVLDGQPNPLTHNKRAVPLKRLASAEDDLVLGVEASLYNKNIHRITVQEYIRSLKPQSGNPSLSRWNSVASSFSVSTGIKSVMDVLDRWQDDPEEILLDLGFGVDEPDIFIKIPSRFINCPSSAEGINIRVFLEAQKMRMDTENPDFYNRFRQLEVLHQVTSVFSNLFNNVSINTSGVTEPPVTTPEEKKASELKEKRKKLAMFLRRASKQTISMAQSKQETQKSTQSSEKDSGSPNAARSDVKIAFRQPRQCLLENGCLSPLEEEQSPAAETPPDLHLEKVAEKENPQTAPLSGVTGGEHSPALECLPRVRTSLESQHNAAISLKGKHGDRQAPDSFEMEEIHSFDEGSVSGSTSGPVTQVTLEDSVIRRENSCQSDSSGFLEEPSVPSLLQKATVMPLASKTLQKLDTNCVDSQTTFRGNMDLSTSHQDPEKELDSDVSQKNGLTSDDENVRSPQLELQEEDDCSCSHNIQVSIVVESNTSVIQEYLKVPVPLQGTSLEDSDLILNECNKEHFNKEVTVPEPMDDNGSLSTALDNQGLNVQLEIIPNLDTSESVRHQDGDMQIPNMQLQNTPGLDYNTNILPLSFGDKSQNSIQEVEIFPVFSQTEEGLRDCPVNILGTNTSQSEGSKTDLEVINSHALESSPDSLPQAFNSTFHSINQQADSKMDQCEYTMPSYRPHKLKELYQTSNPNIALTRSVSVQMSSNLRTTFQYSLPKRHIAKGHSLEIMSQTHQQAKTEAFMKRSGSVIPLLHCMDNRNVFGQTILEHKQDAYKPILSCDSHGYSFLSNSVSLDTGLVNDDGNSDEMFNDRSCHHHCCCSPSGFSSHGFYAKASDNVTVGHLHKTLELLQCAIRNVAAFPYTTNGIEIITKSLRTFRERLIEIEEELDDEQASVYSILSDLEKEEVRHVKALRKAVRQEVNELENQLAVLACHYEEGIQLEMHRLLEVQSCLLAELQVKSLVNSQTTPDLKIKSPTRSISTQCLALPEVCCEKSVDLIDTIGPLSKLSSQGTKDTTSIAAENPTPERADLKAMYSPINETVKKQNSQDKRDFMAFLQSLKESFRTSFNSDTPQ